MNLNEATRCGLGVALNEADLVGVEIDPATRTATVTFLVPVLDDGASPRQRTAQLLLHPVSRLVASLRLGSWDDRAAAVTPLRLEELAACVRSFGGQPIYGWDFFDVHDDALARWGDRLSLDWRSEQPAGTSPRHSLTLFQEGHDRHLDLCLWFDDLEVLDERGLRVSLQDFVTAGRQWWQAFRAGDARTGGHGMVPL